LKFHFVFRICLPVVRFFAIFLFCSAMLMETQPAKAGGWRWAYEYLDACEPSSPDWQICAGYIRGYLGAIKHGTENGWARSNFCIPKDILTEEVARAFKEFVTDKPFSIFAMEGALGITLAVKFPCSVS
jgi:hypothetical protein